MIGRVGRPTVAIELSDDERETSERWTRRHSSSQALALRSRIVLACADGKPKRNATICAGGSPAEGARGELPELRAVLAREAAQVAEAPGVRDLGDCDARRRLGVQEVGACAVHPDLA